MVTIRVLVLRTAGTNCDYETQFAFQQAGAQAERVHVNRLAERPDLLHEHSILVIPGGFSYGDDLGAGRILANELMTKLAEPVRRFIEEGRLVLGICNGFQVLVKAGLLPGPPERGQQATLTINDSHRFEDRWVWLQVCSTRSPFFQRECLITLPVAHGEGKFVAANDQVLEELRQNGQIVLRYVDSQGRTAGYPWNPNGSQDSVAGICDATGRVLGLMPHPERHALPIQHPRWVREGLKEEGDGFQVFRNAVAYAKQL